ncbi:hypothetical protein B0H19DRAFT_362316 [Mycena capillaripes]|nr:hypothetical protein B0H19DRAFT_362316 [Mycena capillaripes]
MWTIFCAALFLAVHAISQLTHLTSFLSSLSEKSPPRPFDELFALFAGGFAWVSLLEAESTVEAEFRGWRGRGLAKAKRVRFSAGTNSSSECSESERDARGAPTSSWRETLAISPASGSVL